MSGAALIEREAFNLLCYELIGSGMSRQVFSSKLLPDCVVKVEEGGGYFQNIVEWETWQRVRGTHASHWFAQCRWISASGSILVMERTRQPALDDFPDKMPVFLGDFKRTNYGISTVPSGKLGKPANMFVCHDYGTNLLFEHGLTKRMKKGRLVGHLTRGVDLARF